MSDGLDHAQLPLRDDRSTSLQDAVARLRWKLAGEECRFQLVQDALAAQRPMIGGFPIAP